MWNTKREKSSIIHINIGIDEFKQIREIAKKTGCKIRIEKKRGIPFILNRYKKRKIFVGTLMVILLAIMFLSRFIWNIEIVGNERINTEELIQSVKENGLKIGEYKSSIDTKKIINNLRLEREDIAWVGITIKGTNAIVKVIEAEEKPKIIDKEEYCNIIADKEGIIEKISANNGTIKVQKGDIVQKGSVLIGRLDGRKVYGCKVCTCKWRSSS